MTIKRRNLHSSLTDDMYFIEDAATESRGANGPIYYVDIQAADDKNDGLSWDTPKQKVASGLLLADTAISAAANNYEARRATVYACGEFTETLVLAAQKTDLVGVGNSNGSFPYITGNFTIGEDASGFRIFNVGIIPTTTAPVITFPANMHGWGLHNVRLYKIEGTASSAAILSTDNRDWIISNSFIFPDAGGIMHTIGINLAGTAMGQGRCLIDDSLICGIEGINVVDTAQPFEGGIVRNSVIRSLGLCIDDNSDALMFANNSLITTANSGSATGSGIVDWNALLAVNNHARSGNAEGPLPALDAHA